MIDDYCAFFAEKLREGIGENGAEIDGATFYPGGVYDQTNPSRVWTGTPTVEIMELDVVPTYYISGKYRNAVKLEVATRTQTRRQASRATNVFRSFIAKICQGIVDADEIDDFAFDVSRVYPDERGKAVGESFYSIIPFTLYEKLKED